MATVQIKDYQNDNQAKVDSTGHLYVTTAGGGVATDVNLTEVGGAPIALGQTTESASLPVTIASDQSTLPTTNASVGVDGSPAPASSTLIGAINPSNNLIGLKTDSSGYLYVTLQGVVVSVTATSPLFSTGGITPNISIQVANSTQDGYLSDTDWITFNNKVSIVGTFDSQASSTNGLTIVNQDIYAQSATTSNPGMVNTTTQSFAGNKTFLGLVAITPSSTTALTVGTNTLIVDTVNNAVGINTAPATTAVLDIVNNSGSTKAIQATGYGSNVGARGRRANGTLSSPTQSLSGDILSFYSARGYGATGFAASSTGAMNIIAGENFTDSSMKTYLTFNTTPTGSVTAAEAMRVASTGVTLGPQSASTAVHQINGGLNITTKTVTASTYAVDTTTTDELIYTDSTSNTIAITLPAPTAGRVLQIYDLTGQAATNNITIEQHASETINGLTQLVIARPYGGAYLESNGTNWTAQVVATSGSLFITSGTTYTTPPNITPQTRFKFTLIGGGGGSAGVATSNGRGTGGGGAGGGILFITGLTPSTAYAIAIGAAGAAGTSAPTAGGGGGNTSLTIGASTYTAAGGGGGQAGANTVGGLPGGATNNFTIAIEGSWGGWNSTAAAANIAGAGGSPPFGFGIGGPGMGPNTYFGAAISGSGYGAGGGGAADVGSAVAGAPGTQGCILVEWNN